MSKKRNGYNYECPHCKNAPPNGGWPVNYRWKTERGFKNHSCYKDVLENQKIKSEQKEICQNLFNEWINLGLSSRRIGDNVFYVAYRVTEPTHEWRGNRRVKVRYEEGRSYFYSSGVITDIKCSSLSAFEDELKEAVKNKTNFSHVYYELDTPYHVVGIYDNEREARTANMKFEAGYKEHCEESARYR